MKYILLLTSILLITLPCLSQGVFPVHGKMLSDESDFEGGIVTINPTNDSLRTYRLESSSEFNIPLEFGTNYVVSFSKPGYYTKKIVVELVDAEQDSLHDKCTVSAWSIDMIHHKGSLSADSVFSKPIGRIYYNTATHCFSIDTEFTMRRVVELESFSKDYRKLTKDMQKIKRIDEDLRETIKTQMEAECKAKMDSLTAILDSTQTALTSAKEGISLRDTLLLTTTKKMGFLNNKLKHFRDSAKTLKDSISLKEEKAESKAKEATENQFELELANIELDRFEARTHEDSVALDKREAELLKTNTTLNNLIEREQARKEQARLKEEEVSRRNSLEYSGITLGLFALFSFTFLIGRFKLPHWMIRLSLFLPFLVFFEFLLCTYRPLHRWLHSWRTSHQAFNKYPLWLRSFSQHTHFLSVC